MLFPVLIIYRPRKALAMTIYPRSKQVVSFNNLGLVDKP